MDFLIRQATKGDAAAIADIEKACFSVPWSEEAIKETLCESNSLFYCALHGEKLFGYIGSYSVLDEVYITNIAVLKEYRKNGAARALLKRLSEDSKKSKKAFVTLEVRKSNLPAVSLYESEGFVLSGERKDFYEKPREDGLIYTLFFGE